MATMGLQNVAFEQSVVRDTGQRNAVVLQNMLVIFEMLPNLGCQWVFKPRF